MKTVYEVPPVTRRVACYLLQEAFAWHHRGMARRKRTPKRVEDLARQRGVRAQADTGDEPDGDGRDAEARRRTPDRSPRPSSPATDAAGRSTPRRRPRPPVARPAAEAATGRRAAGARSRRAGARDTETRDRCRSQSTRAASERRQLVDAARRGRDRGVETARTTHAGPAREIPGGEPSDPGPAPGRVPPGDSRSLRRAGDFALIYRVGTFVISRWGAIGVRGQWRVVEYPTSAAASHAYAKEASRFVSEGFSDYRD